MEPSRRLVLCSLAVAAGSFTALAQSVISARSGMIHFVEGQVFLGDQPVETKFGNFPEVKENGQLRTEDGRAEVLLTPGMFLRLGENSSFRMITNRLIDTRLELLSGTAIIEAEDVGKDNSVTVVYKNATVQIDKKGLYRVDAAAGELRVFEGLAEVTAADNTVEVKDGRAIALDTLAVSKFDKNATDALDRWSARRGEYVAMANVGAANSVRSSLFSGGGGLYDTGFGYGSGNGIYGTNGAYGNGCGMFGTSGSMFNGGWYFNPYFGMYSFVPCMGGAMYSPYGYRFWNPYNVYSAFQPGYYYSPAVSGATALSARAYKGTGYSVNPVRMAPTRGSSVATASSGSLSSRGSGRVSQGSLSSGAISAPVSRGGGSMGSGSHH